MSNRTIEAFKRHKLLWDQAVHAKTSMYFGCTCSNPQCRTTWIVCQLPQPIKRLAVITGWHKQCPCCGATDPQMALPAEIARLLAPDKPFTPAPEYKCGDPRNGAPECQDDA